MTVQNANKALKCAPTAKSFRALETVLWTLSGTALGAAAPPDAGALKRTSERGMGMQYLLPTLPRVPPSEASTCSSSTGFNLLLLLGGHDLIHFSHPGGRVSMYMRWL